MYYKLVWEETHLLLCRFWVAVEVQDLGDKSRVCIVDVWNRVSVELLFLVFVGFLYCTSDGQKRMREAEAFFALFCMGNRLQYYTLQGAALWRACDYGSACFRIFICLELCICLLCAAVVSLKYVVPPKEADLLDQHIHNVPVNSNKY